MQTPFITIDLKKIEHNTRTITALCKSNGVSVLGVTKGTLGMPEVAKAMIRGGVEWIGDSRLDNLERLRNHSIKHPFLLMRSPHLSEVGRVIELADYSLNTEYRVIEALSKESLKRNTTHSILLMVDTGDLREGVLPEEVDELVEKVIKLKGVKIAGIGTNLTDLNGVIPTTENNRQLVEIAEQIEEKYDIKLEYLSAGNSSSLKLLKSGNLPKRINHFRLGESLLLGRETLDGDQWEGTFHNGFTLTAEIIESKLKPSTPIGEIGIDAFGNKPFFKDSGIMKRSILNLGRQDATPDGLIPQLPFIEIIGATSDHTVLDTTKHEELKVGDLVSFDLTYKGMLMAMTSPFVYKNVIE